jgi:hypothetical protein
LLITSDLRPLRRGDRPPGLVGSLDLGDIVNYAARAGAKVVMALDHQQLWLAAAGRC